MKKAILSLVIILFLTGCTAVTSTSEQTTTITSSSITTSNTDSTLPIELETPSNIVMNESYVLSWDAVDFATDYIISINGIESTVMVTTYDLSSLDHNRFYDIQIKAVNQSSQSLYSEKFEFHRFDTIEESVETYYSINSLNDYYLDIIGFGDLLEIRLNHALSETQGETSFWDYNDNILSIHQDFLTKLPVGSYLFSLFFTTGVMSIEITLMENTGPYPMIGQTLIQTLGEDVMIRFDLMGCEFVGLSGNNIESTDYLLEDNVLTIYSNFLDPLFLENPTRNIILGYEFNQGEDTIISFLIIHR